MYPFNTQVPPVNPEAKLGLKYVTFAAHSAMQIVYELLFLVLDISGSMDENDWLPTRLRAAIEALCQLLDIKKQRYPEDRVGVVTFGSIASLVCPLLRVQDYFMDLKRALSSITTSGSTNLAAGIAMAEANFSPGVSPPIGRKMLMSLSEWLFEPNKQDDPESSSITKRIIIATDGHSNAGKSPLKAAASAREKDISIDVIGIGGSPSAVDEDTLKKIASKNPDGSLRYCFIGDKNALIQEFRKLANRIKAI